MNSPTEKQLNFIASLLGVRDNSFHSSAYGAIGSDAGMSTSKAMKKASKQDASTTIDRLLNEKGGK